MFCVINCGNNFYCKLYNILFKNFKLEDNNFAILCYFWHIKMWISHKYTNVPLLLNLPPTPLHIPSLSVEAKFLGRTWVKQKLCTSYLFHMWWCVCFNTTLSMCLTLSFSHCVHSLFSISASLFPPGKYIQQYHFSALFHSV